MKRNDNNNARAGKGRGNGEPTSFAVPPLPSLSRRPFSNDGHPSAAATARPPTRPAGTRGDDEKDRWRTAAAAAAAAALYIITTILLLCVCVCVRAGNEYTIYFFIRISRRYALAAHSGPARNVRFGCNGSDGDRSRLSYSAREFSRCLSKTVFFFFRT